VFILSLRPATWRDYAAASVRTSTPVTRRFETGALPHYRSFRDHSRCLVLAPVTLAPLLSTHTIETRSLPTSLAATHCGFAFYVAFPKSSIPDRDVFYAWRAAASAKAGHLSLVTSFELLPSYFLFR